MIALVFGFLWIRDVTRPVRAPAPEVEPEARRARRAGSRGGAADEPELKAYPRNTFLSVATLGLGGVIGGIVTLPVLGFAVLPAFTNQDEQNVAARPDRGLPRGDVRDRDLPGGPRGRAR